MSLFPQVITATNRQGNPLYEEFQPSLYIPTNARLTSSVQALTGQYITEIYSPKRRVYNEWIKMLDKDPIAAFCAAIKVLRAQITFGEYIHPNKDYQKFIRQNFSNMEGSFRTVLARLASAMTFGYSVAEINFSSTVPGFRQKWMLKNINILDIRYLSVRGCKGKIIEYGYTDRHNNTIYIDHRKCLHITNTDLIPFNTDLVWGSADCERALNWYKLRQLFATEFSIAAKNNATGILWGRTNSTQRMQLYDANDVLRTDATGRAITVSKQKALYMQLKELENNDLIVTDLDTDLNILQTQTGEAFWSYAFDLVEKNLALSFGIPRTLFSESVSSTLGNTGLSQNHKSMLDSSIDAVTATMREEILNKIVKPLLVWEFGEGKEFGEFSFTADISATDQNARISTILSAGASGAIDLQAPEIQAEIRKSLALPPQSDSEKEDNKRLKDLNTALEWINAQASLSQAKTQITDNAVKEQQTLRQDPAVADPNEQPSVEDDSGQYP